VGVDTLNVYGLGEVSLQECLVGSMNTYGNATISADKSSINAVAALDGSQQHISDSVINFVNGYNQSSVFLTNSSCSNFSFENRSQVSVYWYLDVHILDSLLNDVPSANVTAIFPNATQAESESTDYAGWSRLVLMEKIMNASGNYPVGNYTVEAAYDTFLNSTTVNMTENQQISLKLEGFVIPEFPSILLLPALATAVLSAFIFHRKKKYRNR
jgi:hypothetical protein